jgi:pilus assembly protein CpaB
MRSKLLILVAVIAIGAGLAGIFLPQKKVVRPPVQVSAPAPVTYQVFQVKKAHLKRGELVNRADLDIARLSQAEAEKKGIAGNRLFSLAPHAVYAKALNRGDLLLRADIVTPEQPEYIDLTIEPHHVPYAIAVDPDTIVGGIISPGTYVDVLVLTGQGNTHSEIGRRMTTEISIHPILAHIKVLQVEQQQKSRGHDVIENHLILQVTRKQAAQLTIAKQIASLAVYKSAGKVQAKSLVANAGDILPNYKAIKELRADKIIVK